GLKWNGGRKCLVRSALVFMASFGRWSNAWRTIFRPRVISSSVSHRGWPAPFLRVRLGGLRRQRRWLGRREVHLTELVEHLPQRRHRHLADIECLPQIWLPRLLA